MQTEACLFYSNISPNCIFYFPSKSVFCFLNHPVIHKFNFLFNFMFLYINIFNNICYCKYYRFMQQIWMIVFRLLLIILFTNQITVLYLSYLELLMILEKCILGKQISAMVNIFLILFCKFMFLVSFFFCLI